MVSTEEKSANSTVDGSPRIVEFCVNGGIFRKEEQIAFPPPPASGAEPQLLILSGRNGSGKTTILRMIDGMLDLNFDVFRRVPFSKATLKLSDGNVLAVHRTQEVEYPIRVAFQDHDVKLFRIRGEQQSDEVAKFNTFAETILSQINFELLDIHRSAALKGPLEGIEREYHVVTDQHGRARTVRPREDNLSRRVRTFVNEAQVNYRKFFAASDLELLPRILERFKTTPNVSSAAALLSRVAAVQAKFPIMRRFGLQTDDADLKGLVELLSQHNDRNNGTALTLIEAYVEMHESRLKARELISNRLVQFEAIMDEFLINKEIRIDNRHGLSIVSGGAAIKETELSSGEYHFLYMMVSALLCQRAGSIIAIDEPELSLHVSWQRKVVDALANCAAGASPLFIFATHSPAIGAEHTDRVYRLSPIE